MAAAGIATSRRRDVVVLAMAAGTALVLGAFLLRFGGLRTLGVQALLVGLLVVGGLLRPAWLALGAVPGVVLLDTVGAAYRPDLLLVLALGVVWVVGLLTRRWRLVWPAHALLAALAGWVLLAANVHPSAASELGDGSGMRTLLLGFLFFAAVLSIKPPVVATIWTLAVTGATTGLVVFVAATYPYGRPNALGQNSNGLGLLLALGLVAALVLVRGRHSWVALALALVQALALLDTQSRSAYIAAGAGVVVAFWTRQRVPGRVVLVLGIAAAIVLLPSYEGRVSSVALSSRYSADYAVSNAARLTAAEKAIAESVRSPVVGIGYGRFTEVTRDDSHIGYRLATHNEYLRFSAELGMAGLLLLLGTIWACLPIGRRRAADAAVLAPVVAYLVAMAFGNPLAALQLSVPFWLLLAAIAPRRARHVAGRVVSTAR